MKPFYNFLKNAKVQFDFALFSFAMQKLRRLAAFLLGSENCAVCKKQNVFLCNSCFCKTFALAKNVRRCKKCGRILNNGKNYCVDCAGGNIFSALDLALPVFAYTGNRKKLLQLWKMEQNRQLVFYFARFFYKYYAKYFNSIVLVGVPPRPGKIFNQGWDQIDDLVLVLQGKYKLRFAKMLLRTDGLQQKYRSRDQRINGGARYKLNPRYKGAIPKKVLLIDDVLTTGATLEECAEVLKSAGVEQVFALTLFFVPKAEK